MKVLTEDDPETILTSIPKDPLTVKVPSARFLDRIWMNFHSKDNVRTRRFDKFIDTRHGYVIPLTLFEERRDRYPMTDGAWLILMGDETTLIKRVLHDAGRIWNSAGCITESGPNQTASDEEIEWLAIHSLCNERTMLIGDFASNITLRDDATGTSKFKLLELRILLPGTEAWWTNELDAFDERSSIAA